MARSVFGFSSTQAVGFGRFKIERKNENENEHFAIGFSVGFSVKPGKSKLFKGFSVHVLVSCDMIQWCQAAVLPYLRLLRQTVQEDTLKIHNTIRQYVFVVWR